MSQLQKLIEILKNNYDFKELEKTEELIRGYCYNLEGIWGVEIDIEKEEVRWYTLDELPNSGEDWDNLTDTQAFSYFLN
jgi:hypothetical protein